MITSEGVRLIHGDCLEVLKGMPDNYVDSIVTDPPYGLSFMGKKWDYDAPEQAIWEECLRVLKPGGHLLAFAGTRTQHRMAVRIEDAGFEIRDMIAWVYGSGFPKSMDVSKAIDKMDAADARRERQLRFTEWMRSTGLTSAEIDRITDTNMGGHYTTAASQPSIATRDHFEKLRPHFGVDVPEWVEQLVDERTVESENFKRREVIGSKTKARSSVGNSALPTCGEGKTVYKTWSVTAPSSDEAKQWQGWGTALKPALEPITVARKPFKGTVAANVLEWGTGAINIDVGRVATVDDLNGVAYSDTERKNKFFKGLGAGAGEYVQPSGRWPANLIHDGSDEPTELLGDAARFFYCAKASKRDRDDGLDGFEAAKTTFAAGTGLRNNGDGTPRNQTPSNKNTHPTVKPTDLMAYLCRLVTPPGGVVLDPFMGSGSTGKAAVREGFRFIGIEMDAEYLAIAEARIAHEAGK